jgi:hypothetical protein
MGFRQGAYATMWNIDPVSSTVTKARISISKKNKQSGEYETDFSGFVSFLGTTAAKKASVLKERDRIKIGDCDVKTYYDRNKNMTYYNFNIFSFEDANGGNSSSTTTNNYAENPVEDSDVSDNLPF